MVVRALSIPGSIALSSNTVGPVTYAMTDTAQEGILALTPSEAKMLRPYRRMGTTVELR
jgi:hypothetical protein